MPRLFQLFVCGMLCWGLSQPKAWAQSAEDSLRITLDIDAPTLQQALEALEAASPLQFFFQPNWLPQEPVRISFKGNTVQGVLDQLLIGTSLLPLRLQPYAYAIVPKEEWQNLGGTLQAAAPLAAPSTILDDKWVIDSVGISSRLPSGQEALLVGTLRDALSQDPITGATLTVVGQQKGAISDENGRFQLALPLGNTQITIEATGYDPAFRTVVVMGDGEWNIELELKAYSLDAVNLEGEAGDRNVSSATIGINQLRIDEIKGIPAFMGEVDIVKSLLTLPGVNTVGEGASGFNVRGGNVDQNLILLDGTPVLNSSHVLGFFSLFHPDVVNKVTLYKGHMPAQFGGRLASVLDVGMRDGNFRKFHMKGGIGLVSGRLLLDGPLVKDKVSFLVGLRSSYSNWALRLARDPLINTSSARFSDLNGRLSFKLRPNQRLDFSAYRSRDIFRYADQFGYGWETDLLQGRYQYIFNPRAALTVRVQNGRYTANFFDPEGRDAFDLQTGLGYTRSTARLRLTPSRDHNVQAGVEWVNYRGLAEEVAPNTSNSLIRPNIIPKDRGQELAAFVQDELQINSFVSLSAGLRFSAFLQTGNRTIYNYAEGAPLSVNTILDSTEYGPLQLINQYGGLEPRVALKVSLDEASSIKVSYNRVQQFIHLISNTTASTPVDIWQLSTQYIPPSRAHSYSAGYFRNFRANAWETSIELYYKHITDLVSYKDLPKLLQNRYLETELLRARGRAYGAEFSIRKNRGAWTGWLGYSYSRSLRQVEGDFLEETINRGEWFPAPFDQPHQVNLVSNFKINRRNTFSLNFTYSTGRPITVPVGDYVVGNTVIPQYSDRNQFRIPDYHRLDLSYTVEGNAIRKQKYQDSFTFSLYNLYFRRNAFSVFFLPDERQIPRAYLLAILGTAIPAITYNFSF